jgi:hypothetical protein
VSDTTPPPPEGEDLVFRRGKLRRRDDPAIDLFREALSATGDPGRVRRILAELGRLYDPVRNAPIVEPATRRAVLEELDGGRPDGARRRLQEAYEVYTRKAAPPGPPPGPPL